VILLALQIAAAAHKGQKDKGGNDYINHPLRVAELVEGEEEKMVAFRLHHNSQHLLIQRIVLVIRDFSLFLYKNSCSNYTTTHINNENLRQMVSFL
jgi:hypothetical protein